ncbi:unnamed protein product, partial [Didymodactylos carnosus]
MSAATTNQLQASGEWNTLLSNKVVFLSGGGGYIAQSIAHTCYLHGAKIILADISKQAALNVKQQILTQDNKIDDDDNRILVIEVDVTNESCIKQAVDLAMSKWNKINILINTTAVFPMGTVEDITDEVWNSVLAINVKGYALMAKHIVPIMKCQQETCSIINLASGSGMIAIQKSVPYSATKAAIIQMTKNLALDLGTHNIRVISISPGPI